MNSSRDIAGAADQLESAVKRLQMIVEGASVGPNGTGTILVADDQEPVRHLIVKTLTEHGYTVFGAASGAEALEKCKAYPGPIHLILADVGMEPLDGYELVRDALLVRPNTKAIYMSGNLLDNARAMAGTAFLLKGATNSWKASRRRFVRCCNRVGLTLLESVIRRARARVRPKIWTNGGVLMYASGFRLLGLKGPGERTIVRKIWLKQL